MVKKIKVGHDWNIIQVCSKGNFLLPNEFCAEVAFPVLMT
jgi:hypothetical protein